ncbi:MAG TPA: hypothetical protein P5543_01645 [Planctomycetota bacterium]|nr:hypothetical protein [Planctomycetota bacterium]
MYYKNRQHGIAIITVVSILGMLFLFSLPFAVMMTTEKRETSRALLHTKTKLLAEGIQNHAIGQLNRTTDVMEKYAPQDELFKTPDFDSEEEHYITFDSFRKLKMNVRNTKGEMWSSNVEDEQGKININTATPWILGNLFGSAIVTKSVERDQTLIEVDSTVSFPKKNGMIWIDGELISYKRKTATSFQECTRGLFSHTPYFLSAQFIRQGSIVIDARAHYICRYRLLRTPGQYTPYSSVEELKKIADTNAYNIGALCYSIEPELYDKIAPFLTVHSQVDAPLWIQKQFATQIQDEQKEGDVSKISIKDPYLYAPGMTVKIENNNQVVYAMIHKIEYTFVHNIILDTILPFPVNENTSISVLAMHPININSAMLHTVHALMKGRQYKINEQAANLLSQSIIGHTKTSQPLFSHYDFFQFLKNIQKQAQEAKYVNEDGSLLLQESYISMLSKSLLAQGHYRSRLSGIFSDEYYRPSYPAMPPIIYKNSNTYTIESTAVQNSTDGIPLASYTLQSVATVAPPMPQRWWIETQKDFLEYQEKLPSYRTIVFPNIVTRMEDKPETNIQDIKTKEGIQYFCGISVDSTRIYPSLRNIKSIPYGVHYPIQYEPFDNKFDGDKGKSNIKFETVSENRWAPFIFRQMTPGAMSFWVYMPDSSNKKIFTIHAQQNQDNNSNEWQNNITLEYMNQMWVLRVTDNTLENIALELRHKHILERGWYYVTAAWHSTLPGGLSMWIDNKPVGKCGYSIKNTGLSYSASRLANDIRMNSQQITLTDVSGLNREGVIQIGSEAIEYSHIIDKTLIVRDKYQNYTAKISGRGARGTRPQNHPKDAVVSPWGYTASFKTPLPPATTLASELHKGGTVYTSRKESLLSTEKKIKVQDTSQFPLKGVVLILFGDQKEYVYYDRKKNDEFIDCKRGFGNSTAQNYIIATDSPTLIYFIPMSIHVVDNSNFQVGEKNYLQIDDEWISYDSKIEKDIFLLKNFESINISYDDIKDGQYNLDVYGVANTKIDNAGHRIGTKVFPVCRINNRLLGPFDQVTLLQDNNKEKNEVKWVYDSYVSFQEDVTKIYNVHDILQKFPNGYLPNAENVTIKWGDCLVDEVSLIQTNQTVQNELFFLNNLVQKQASSLLLSSINKNNTLWPEKDAGICKIGDDYITYLSYNNNKLSGTVFGLGGSEQHNHAQGSPVYPIFYMPVSNLKTKLLSDEDQVHINNAIDFPMEGHVMIDDEIIGYHHRDTDFLKMPKNYENKGAFRGAFGTTPVQHSLDAIIYPFITKYYNRYSPRTESGEGAFFYCAKTARQSYWKTIQWEQVFQNKDVPIVIQARLDGKPSWNTIPTNKPGGIYLFTSGDKTVSTYPIQAFGDTLELRIHFPYEHSAYTSGYWKERNIVKNIYVEYIQNTCIWQSQRKD